MTHPYLTHLVEQIDKAFPGSGKITRRFADRPEAEQMAVEIEAESLAERAADAEMYRTVDERYEASGRRAVKELKVAQDSLVKCERDRLAALDDVARKSAAAASFSHRASMERGHLEQKLRDSAHPLIAKTINALRETLTNDLRHNVLALHFGEYYSTQTGEKRHGFLGSNHAACQVVIDATRTVLSECMDMQLTAVPAADMETRLGALLERLRSPYAVVGLGSPYIEGGEVISPRAARPVADTAGVQ